jgi:hypothetical protein
MNQKPQKPKTSISSPHKTNAVAAVKQEASHTDGANTPPSNLKKFVDHPVIGIITIVFAIFGACGGLPAIIQLLEYQSKKPKFNYVPAGFLDGTMQDTMRKTESNFIMLTGTLTNEGEKPLLPHIFNAAIEYKGEKMELRRSEIPFKSLAGNLDPSTSIQYTDVVDLQKTKQITDQEPVNGSLLFKTTLSITDLDNLIKQDKMIIYLTCLDFYGKSSTIKFKVPNRLNPKNAVYPKHGIRLQ